METLDLVGLAPGRDTGGEPFQFVDSTFPPTTGWWSGGSEEGLFRGHAGLFRLNLIRPEEGFLEWPREYRRERKWFKYVRQLVPEAAAAEGFVLWMTDHRTPPTRLVCRYVDNQVLTVNNDYGGSGVLNVQTEGLLNDTLYNLETGTTLR